MRKQFLYFMGLTVVSIFLLSVTWEFLLEEWVQELLFEEEPVEAAKDRWEFVFTTLVFASLALILPIFLNLRNLKKQEALQDQLRSYTLELERSNRDLEDFAAIVSHDLKEPLRKIVSFADRLEFSDSELNDQALDSLERMRISADRMEGLIDAVLLYSKVSKDDEPMRTVDLGKLVAQVIEDLEDRISRTNGSIHLGALPVIEADENQMRQLFQNLLVNALKFHREGVVPVIRVESGVKEKGLWKIVVRDNGIGFDEKHAERIFEPFKRLHGKSDYEGSGMGLAICRKIVHRHHGEIRVKSQPEEGTTFSITLPEKQSALNSNSEN